jgi:hypothetical protein
MTYRFYVAGAEFDIPPRLVQYVADLSEECTGIWVETAPSVDHAVDALKERLGKQVGFPCIDVDCAIDVV